MTQLRSFIDRVLRLKAEQDKLTSDIREVYAEAKANSFDKTIMGQLVVYLRRREKDPLGCEEKGAIFEVYLHNYDQETPSTHKNTRAHEKSPLPPHDEDGVIIEDAPSQQVASETLAAGGAEVSSLGLTPTQERIRCGVPDDRAPLWHDRQDLHDAQILQTNSEPAAPSPATVEPAELLPVEAAGSSFPELPDFLRRTAA